MTCELSEYLIQKHLDGRLSQTERLTLEAHLASCASCRQEWEAQRRLARLADRWASRSLALSDPGEAFTLQVLSRVEAKPASPRLPVWLPLTAALFLLAAVIFLPGLPKAHAGALVLALQSLPEWLAANMNALPAAALSLLRFPQAALLSPWAGVLLPAMAALNAAFCVHARRTAGQRSVS